MKAEANEESERVDVSKQHAFIRTFNMAFTLSALTAAGHLQIYCYMLAVLLWAVCARHHVTISLSECDFLLAKTAMLIFLVVHENKTKRQQVSATACKLSMFSSRMLTERLIRITIIQMCNIETLNKNITSQGMWSSCWTEVQPEDTVLEHSVISVVFWLQHSCIKGKPSIKWFYCAPSIV